MIRSIIWDVGGTLFDTYPAMTGAFLQALAEYSISAPAEWVRGLAQVSQRHCAQVLAETYQLDAEDFWQRYRQHLRAAPPAESPPFPGAREVCARISALGGLNLIASHRAPESIEQLLGFYHLQEYFSGCLTTSDGYPRKPDPAMLLELVQRYQLVKSETLAVGDREIDILAGQAAGLPTCLFGERGGAARPELHIHRYRELMEKITSHEHG